MRVILIGHVDEFDIGDKDGSPLEDNAINRASLRLEELKFGDLAGVQNDAVQEDPVTGYGRAIVAECGQLPFTTEQMVAAAERYGWNNAVSWARSGTPPTIGVFSSWLDGFLHGMGAMAGLTPQGEEMKGRLPR